MSRRAKNDTRAVVGMRRWLDERYATVGGFKRWEASLLEDMPPAQQAVLFGITVTTVYDWRKWYRETEA